MKRFIALLLVAMLLLISCNNVSVEEITSESPSTEVIETTLSPECELLDPEEPTTEESTSEESTTEEPTTEEPTTEEPTTEESTTEEPTTEEPTTEESTTEEPTTEEPTPEEPTTEEPTTEESTTEEPTTEEPSTEESTTDEPSTEESTTDEPSTEESTTAPHTRHSYEASVTQPTCTEDGYTTYTCTGCTKSYTANVVSATGHSYKATVTDPTCEDEGYTTYKCSGCGDSYVSDRVSAGGHIYNAIVTQPSCESGGYTTYTCQICFVYYTANEVNATGHSWTEATTSAPKTCTACGVTEGEKLPEPETEAPSEKPTEGVTTEAVTEPPASSAETLYVTYINVGQGDSILIKVGDCDILIDAGTASYGSTVSNYLKNQGVDDIELMINTHPDADHCGGLTAVLNSFVVEEVWISKDTSKTTAAYKNFVSAISKEGLTAKQPNAGTVYTYGYMTLTVIYSAYISGDSNNSSIVVMLEYGSFKFLFTGDVGQVSEPSIINSGYDISCDVLKVGHHGSKYSSTTAFLNAIGAEYGVICVGSNTYGHPTADALNRLSSAGVSVYRTDKNGNIVFSTDGATLYLPGGGTDTTGSGSGIIPAGPSSGSSSSGGSSSGGSSSGGSSSGSTTTEYL